MSVEKWILVKDNVIDAFANTTVLLSFLRRRYWIRRRVKSRFYNTVYFTKSIFRANDFSKCVIYARCKVEGLRIDLASPSLIRINILHVDRYYSLRIAKARLLQATSFIVIFYLIFLWEYFSFIKILSRYIHFRITYFILFTRNF